MAGQRSKLERHGFPTIDLDFDDRRSRSEQDTGIQRHDDLELGLKSAMRRQDSGATKSVPRARWSHQMKRYLIELLKDYNVPGYRIQNAWSKEAWTGIASRMNEKFGLSPTFSQVKPKEQDLKKDFRSVKDLVSESDFGWDHNAMMGWVGSREKNRELFLSFSSDTLRLGWVTRQIGHNQTDY